MDKTIYLVAPSFGCTTEPYKTRLKESIKNLKTLGFKIIEGKNIHINKGTVASNTPQLRAQEILEAFKSEADIIMSVGGGELMCEILPYISFKKLKKYPNKIFVGFSDNTNLTFTLTTINGMKTIYGTNAPNYYTLPLQYDSLDTIRMIEGDKVFTGYNSYELYPNKENPLAPLNLTEEKKIMLYNYQGKFSGIFLGGCLDTLTTICGTKYDTIKKYTKDKEIIWYLEACDLNPLGIRRALFNLKEAGWFKTVKAFLIGRALCNDEIIFDQNKYTAVLDILNDYNVPILIDIDLGHLAPSLPFMNGAKGSVEIKDNNIIITYE